MSPPLQYMFTCNCCIVQPSNPLRYLLRSLRKSGDSAGEPGLLYCLPEITTLGVACAERERERDRVSLKMPNTGIACRTVSVEVRVETWFERLMQMQLQPDMDCATQLKDERPDSMVWARNLVVLVGETQWTIGANNKLLSWCSDRSDHNSWPPHWLSACRLRDECKKNTRKPDWHRRISFVMFRPGLRETFTPKHMAQARISCRYRLESLSPLARMKGVLHQLRCMTALYVLIVLLVVLLIWCIMFGCIYMHLRYLIVSDTQYNVYVYTYIYIYTYMHIHM